MSKTCIVSFANSDSVRYSKNLARLNEMCAKHCPEIDFLGFTEFEQIGSPHHTDLHYAFKVFVIRKALDLGYTKIIWADSAVYPISDITPFLVALEEKGVVFFENIGHSLGQWCSDKCLDYYEIDRAKSMRMPQTMNCLFALDFEKPIALEFWQKFEADMLMPEIVNGSWTNTTGQVSKYSFVKGHRHDQSIASCILNKMNVPMLNPMQTFLAYKEWYERKDLKINETVCFNSNSY